MRGVGCDWGVVSAQRLGPLLRYSLLRVKWTVSVICEELSGGWLSVHSGERLGPLSRYGLLRVKRTISEKEAWWGGQWQGGVVSVLISE